jgi:putative glycerol-1-phosphate prenyltransferase
MKTFERLMQIKRDRGAGYVVLIDPDKLDAKALPAFMREATSAGVDAFFIGGSLMLSNEFETALRTMKENTSQPVVIFPGSLFQISPLADAILYIVLISGRNPDSLIGSHVIASPIIKRMKLEPISTAYMLIEGGTVTSAEFMSNTKPIPRAKPDIAAAHAIAAEMIGMKMVYLEAGSGAAHAVPDEMVRAVSAHCSLPLIVGGGIRTPEEARAKVKAGASFIVTGTAVEENSRASLIKEFADAIHGAARS